MNARAGAPSTAIAWFRRDLRLHDHPALAAAAECPALVCLYVLDDRLLAGPAASANRAWFLRRSLHELAAAIAGCGGSLIIRRGRPEDVVPVEARAAGAGTVFVSRDYSPFGRRRDARVRAALASGGIRFSEWPGVLAVEPDEIVNASGGGFTRFGPFYRRWASIDRRPVLPAPARLPPPPADFAGRRSVTWDTDGPAAALLPAGEKAARRRLDTWLEAGLAAYGDSRDRLDIDGTSRLGQDLRWGLLSPNEVLARAAGEGGAGFARQVAWRDFYHHLAWHRPEVLRGPLKPSFASLPWRDNPAALAAWQEGRTGYPVVDAAIRQLLATGWMHNRARMVAASFLAKNLLIDHRHGERFFMQHLVDGDPAVNNGNWQWASSTGTDPVPYFRVFNPVLQGQRFDPGGSYVRRWLPELGRVPLPFLHKPWTMPDSVQREAGCLLGRDYPWPIVPLDGAIERARAFFRSALTTG